MLPGKIEVFAHRHLAEKLARFGTVNDAAARDRTGGHAAQRSLAEADFARIGDEAGNRVEERGLAGAVQTDDGNEFALAHIDRDFFERLRLAVEDAHPFDLEKRRPFAGRRIAPLRRLDLAAEIDAPHGLVAHDLRRRTFGHIFADVHRQHAVDQGGDALDVVVDQQNGPILGAKAANEIGEGFRLRRRQAGERLVDQHHLGIARDRLGHFHPAQRRKGQRRRMAVHHIAQADALGNRTRALVDPGLRGKAQQRIRQQRQLDVLEHGLAMERPRMLKDDADAGAGDAMRRPAGDVDAIDPHRAGIGPFDAHDELHDRRFARAVRPDEAEDLARGDIEADVLDRDQPAERLGQAAHLEARGAAHSRSPVLSAWPSSPSGKNRITASAIAATQKVLS